MSAALALRALLELGTMVGIYFRTDRLPVLFLLYVAMTAMTRFLAVDIKTLPIDLIVIVTGGIFVLALAVLVLQIAASKQNPAVDKKWLGRSVGPGPGGHA